jgi:hypothetical protein
LTKILSGPTHCNQADATRGNWCGVAFTPKGLMPGKCTETECVYFLDGKELKTSLF